MAKVITLVVGSTGAGKTTYAREAALNNSAIVYSIDNWMKNLYGDDMPNDPVPEWFHENQKWYVQRIGRCEEQIKQLTLQRARYDQPSFLDLGFSTIDHRKSFIEFYQRHGVEVEIAFLDISAEKRWERVQERNNNKGETFVMTVDSSLFDYMESIFEKPSENEGAFIKIVKN